MAQKKENTEEEFVFEFYDEDYAKSLEEVEKPVLTEEYNDIDFETYLNSHLNLGKLILCPMIRANGHFGI